MKRITLFLTLAALVLVGCDGGNSSTSESELLPPPVIADPNGEAKSKEPENGDVIKILHLNDTHGSIEQIAEENEPGMTRIATYVKNKRAEAKTDVVMISSGDMFQGSLDSNINKGRLMIDIMKEMRFDSMSIGNHEFDWGVSALEANATYAMDAEGDWSFPFLSANILNPEGQYDIGYLSTTFNRGGARISVVGSIDAGVYDSIDAAVVEGYSFTNATAMVIAEAQRLRAAGSDLIIYSTHDKNREVDSRIANYVDAVFTGHSHYYSIDTMTSSDSRIVPVIESLSNGKAVGEVDFVYNAASNRYELGDYKNTPSSVIETLAADVDVQGVYDTYLDAPCADGIVVADSLRELKTNKIGEITSSSKYASGGISENEVREMFAIAQLENYQDESYGTIHGSSYNEARSGWNVGDITYSDVYKAFPFDNATVIIEATGEQLKRWNTYTYFDGGLTKYDLVNTTTYKVVTSTYIINNNEKYNYTSVFHTDENMFQRHVLYQEFLKANAPDPWG